jgi:Fe-S cluster assembly protein SufD
MTTTTALNTPGMKDAHLAAFAGLAPSLPGAGVGWVDDLRRESLDRFADAGVPHRGLEAWKFTGLNALDQNAFTPNLMAKAPAPQLADLPIAEPRAAQLVFVDGRLVPDLCQIGEGVAGLTITTLAAALNNNPDRIEGHIRTNGDTAGGLWNLNAAFMADGAVIRLDDGVTIEHPIVLHFVETGQAFGTSHLRNLILLGANAQARIIETYIDAGNDQGPGFTNSVTDATLGEGATLTHARIQDHGLNAVHTSRAVVDIAAHATYQSIALALGARVSRQETDVSFSNPGGTAQLYGAYLGRGRQHLDHTTRIDHAHPGCVTEESFRGVLDDRAHGVFQGLIRVAPHAVGTDARQSNRALLLSDHAVADAKPELEILADDVKCAHGATVGDIDADALFYLMSRGIPEATARDLLVAGFIGELIDGFNDRPLAGHLRDWVARWQSQNGGDSND